MLDQEGNTEGSGQGVAVSLVCRSGLQVQPEFSRPRSFVVGRRLDENDSAAMLNSVNSILKINQSKRHKKVMRREWSRVTGSRLKFLNEGSPLKLKSHIDDLVEI